MPSWILASSWRRPRLGGERLRVSRDLHDLLGHTLAAISLKGDLAVRLLALDGPAALAEIENLTGVAREALAGLQDITNGGGKVTLTRELGNAQALLTAAGVAVSVCGDIPGIPPAAEQVRRGRVREGATNILRHATASTVTITPGTPRLGSPGWRSSTTESIPLRTTMGPA